MGETNFPLNDPLAVKRYSLDLAVNVRENQYFTKFIGENNNSMIKLRTELSKNAGDNITMGLRQNLTGDGTEGDDNIENTDAEEALIFFNDKLQIDQKRKGTVSKGKMSEQRVPYNLRKEGKSALAEWNGKYLDEQLFIYLSGARGVDTSLITPLGFTGRAGNVLETPDSNHHIFGGSASGKADLASDDTMTRDMSERLLAIAETSDPLIHPFKESGEDKRILLMHTFQAFNLRKDHSDGDWLDIRKNTDGKDSLIYKNSLGELAGLILHKHKNVIRFDDYGSEGNVAAARALLLGKMAGMIAFGGAYAKKRRFSWHEETYDRGNGLSITTSTIFGCKKTRYKNKDKVDQGDYAVIAVDTAYTNPN